MFIQASGVRQIRILCLPKVISVLSLLVSGLFVTVVSSAKFERLTSNVCTSQNECPPNAICDRNDPPYSNGACVCRAGFIMIAEKNERECFPVVQRLGDPCIYDSQCFEKFSTESECWQGHCECKVGSHYVDKTQECYTSVKIGERCRLTHNCVGQGTICRSGICECPHGHHFNFERTNCLPDTYLGDVCNSDAECVTGNSRCYDLCRCSVDYVSNENHTKCLRIAERLFDDCEESVQCSYVLNHSYCDSNYLDTGICKCLPGYHDSNYTCHTTVELGGICEVDENCSQSAGAICKNGRCLCDDDFPEMDGYCFSAASDNHITLTPKLITLLLIFSNFITLCVR